MDLLLLGLQKLVVQLLVERILLHLLRIYCDFRGLGVLVLLLLPSRSNTSYATEFRPAIVVKLLLELVELNQEVLPRSLVDCASLYDHVPLLDLQIVIANPIVLRVEDGFCFGCSTRVAAARLLVALL